MSGQTAKAAAADARDTAKDAAETQRAKAKAYLQRKVPQDRRDQTVFRLKVPPRPRHGHSERANPLAFQKALLECQQHPDYQQAIQTLLDLASEYGGHARDVGAAGSGTVQDARSSLAQAEADLKARRAPWVAAA